jgi:hypothetical protein
MTKAAIANREFSDMNNDMGAHSAVLATRSKQENCPIPVGVGGYQARSTVLCISATDQSLIGSN